MLTACSVDTSDEGTHGVYTQHTGITTRNTLDNDLRDAAYRMAHLIGNEFGVDFADAITGLDVVVTANLNAVLCNGNPVSGCTKQHSATSYSIDLIYRIGDRPQDSALAHELGHLYACSVLKACDSNHENRSVWIAVGNAERAY